MSVDVNVNTTETNVNINASTVVETIDITATVQQDVVEIEVFPNVTVVNVTKKSGEDGQDGQDGVNGQDGQDLTLQDFNASEEVSELSDDAEFFVKEDGVFKRITKENVFQKTDTFHFIITSTGVVNRWFLHNNNQGTFSTSIQSPIGNINDIINKPYLTSIGRKPAGKKIKSVELYITYHTVTFGSNKIRLIIFVKQAANNVNYDANVNAIILYDKLIPPSDYQKTLYNVDNIIDDIEIPDNYFIQWAMNFENLTSAITIYNSAVIVNYK